MATKRSTPLDNPPSASSDDDDETEDEQEHEIITHKTIQQQQSSSCEEEEEEEESEEEEVTPQPVKNPQIQNPNFSEEESESDEEEEEETPVKTSIEQPKTLTLKQSSIFEFESDIKSPTASDFAIKPSKKIVCFGSPENTATSKRPNSGSDLKEKKKIKVSNGDVDDEKKSSVIKRVWSEDDELMLLQGFIDYQSKKGCSPLSDMDGFYQFIMDSIPGNASKSQLYEKVRRLKKKFRVNLEKVSANGEDAVFVKPHERKLFEVSKKIWGIDGCESVVCAIGLNAKAKIRHSKIKPKIEVKEKEKEEVVDEGMMDKMLSFETLYPYWDAGLNSEVASSLKLGRGVVALIKEKVSLIGEAKAKEFDEKWKALLENEVLLRKRRIVLMSKVIDVETT